MGAIDWSGLGDETVELLRQYLAIDTTNPPGNEVAGTTFLAEALGRQNIDSQTVESAPGRANLVARLRGDGSLGGIVLHHHIDVVYADRRYWTVDPFGGVIKDGYLYGRGALDMKSTGILQLGAMLAIKRARIPLKRDLIYLGTADEEAGSAYGARFLADRHRDWFAGAEYALSELAGIEQHAGYRAPFGSIVISEKTGLPLKLTARSEPGHGSMPWPETAPHRLVRALGRLLAADRPLRVLPEVAEFFRQMAHVLPPDDARGFDDITSSLRDPAFRARFLADRYRAATVRTTFAVNMLRGSEKLNVIPPEAVADIDCRMLAGDDPQEILRWVRGVIDDEAVEVTTVREPKLPNLSPPDTELYKALADSLRTPRARRGGGARDPRGLHRQLGLPRDRPARLRLEPVRGGRRGDAAHPRQRRADLARQHPRRRARLHRDAAGRGRGLTPVVAAARLTIRPGTRRDVPTILALIRGLADYERLAHECVATPGGIRRDGFGRRRYFETLICRRGGRPIGFALYFFTYSTFLARPTLYLEDLFVLPAERGRGAGRALLRALARIALRRRCGRMEWTVLDWNRPAIRVYQHLGAALRRDWILTRLTGTPLARLAGVSAVRRATARARPAGRARTPTSSARPRTRRRPSPRRATRSRSAKRARARS